MTYPVKPQNIDSVLWKARLEVRHAKFTSASHTKLETSLVESILDYIEYLESELEE